MNKDVQQVIVNMIEWSNSNSGFLLVLLTAIYVSATIIILLVMMKSNKLAHRSLGQAVELEKSRVRPYLYLTIKTMSKRDADGLPGLPYAYVLLKNHGKSQAYNVTVEINPLLYSQPTINGKKIKYVPYFIESVTPNIVPEQTLVDSLGFTQGIFEIYKQPVFNGIIKYSDSLGTEYTTRFSIDLAVMSNTSAYDEVFS